ncbi:extracellular solute-binding protein family 3 [Gloeothece citriformis PCC 7424]|uniref:Extracellular solute-binding protein family 3 n=1 Tax=Gloeothece citriformis (strain PCC 7424) TaxID=65393 RepID=B7KF84_GLOC7|nr:amino acid ABC transporter substrate-binding protein [Gloeothece citriformis]ACK71800.1 extracellular solute-binding protein family 3 [Gloeothece citriformis PCC 7424]
MNKNKITLFFLSLICLTNYSLKVYAETVLEKIQRTGELNAGARIDAIPFGYKTDKGEWTGYSVELLRLIHQDLEKKLNKPIKLNLKEVTIDNRFQTVEKQQVDIVCGATTITQQRLEKVDFSIPFFMTGSQFLVKLEDATNFDINGTLKDKAIAYLPNTTTDQIIRQIYPFAKWQTVTNRDEGVRKLKAGEVTAVVSDGILLVGEIVRQGNNPRDFALMPNVPMTTELYACILPKNNPQWKEFVDQTIGSENNTQLQEQWFNLEKSPFPYIIRTNP